MIDHHSDQVTKGTTQVLDFILKFGQPLLFRISVCEAGAPVGVRRAEGPPEFLASIGEKGAAQKFVILAMRVHDAMTLTQGQTATSA
ncbi:hypothetical protein DDZ18_03630 [Marinicauda salina]|uniref:Uncharacterized protein n=1 Tax=Marinicauda salina TaxID=2135793 RepID=A0A2U2BXJ7_9PROT|nr:hypothetical protein DDZ18_03630 [Marinicauda salina]